MLESVKTIVGEEKVRDRKMRIQVEVQSAEELSRILKLANEKRQKVRVKQGKGVVSIDLQKPAKEKILTIDLRRMNDLKLFREFGYVEVGPFVAQRDLNNFLSPYGYEFADVVPPVTLGGMVSVNMSGHLVDSYSGKLGDHVLGLQVVLPTGEIIETGTKSLRKISGMDLTRLFIGSQALLGVITRIRLRLIPKPLEKSWMIACFDSVVELASSVTGILNGSLGFYPRIFDFVDDVVLNTRLGVHDFKGSVLITETTGEMPGEAHWKMDRVIKTISSRARDIKAVRDETEWKRLWEARAGPTPAEWDKTWCGSTIANRTLDYRIAGETFDPPLQTLVETVKALHDLRAEFSATYPEAPYVLLGHMGGPTIHATLRFPPSWDKEEISQVTKEFREKLLPLKLKYSATTGDGGGTFPEHKKWFRAYYGETQYQILWRLKDMFDPNHILNMHRMED